MAVWARKSVPSIATLLLAAFFLSCPKTPSAPQDPDAHVIPPDCNEGERRCLVNMMDTCVGGHFGTISYCSDYCDPVEGCVGAMENVDSFIWIANTGEGTLSKVNTRNTEEVARYLTCSYSDRSCDPSRTSVNLHGDVVVSNRGCGNCSTQIPVSSVTKAHKNLIDADFSGQIAARCWASRQLGPSDTFAGVEWEPGCAARREYHPEITELSCVHPTVNRVFKLHKSGPALVSLVLDRTFTVLLTPKVSMSCLPVGNERPLPGDSLLCHARGQWLEWTVARPKELGNAAQGNRGDGSAGTGNGRSRRV